MAYWYLIILVFSIKLAEEMTKMAKEPRRRPPQASRTIEGLRDTGYEPGTALADIIDNSIAAGATRINIEFGANPLGELALYVSDNGEGMSEEKLDDAMTYGSSEREDPASLGKFGLGMKTASTSMARTLTVVTRDATGEGPYAAKWDLDFVRDQNDWLLQYPEGQDIQDEIQKLDEVSDGGSGTTVSWKKIDRLLSRQYKTVAGHQNDIRRKVRDLKEGIELTYHKFLEGGQDNEKSLKIYFNGESVKPWNPFGNGLAEELLSESIPIKAPRNEGSTEMVDLGQLHLTSYVYPPATEMTEEQKREVVIGGGTYNRSATPTGQQGIYVYRHNRLLCYGNWLGIRRVEPHQNLHRVDLSFDYKLDDYLALDLKKSQVSVNTDIIDYLSGKLAPMIAEADNRARRNERKTATIEGGNIHNTSNTIVEGHASDLSLDVTVEPGTDGHVNVINNYGPIQIGMGLQDAPEFPHIVPSETMNDPGILWEPFFNSDTKKQAVRIWVGHEFYRRLYRNQEPGLGIQGLDSLLWALMQAELKTINTNNHEVMRGIRFHVSSILKEISMHNFNEPEVD